MAGNSAKTYPRFGANIWWQLRDEFKRSLPKIVEVNYLAAKLQQSQKSARNLIPHFRALGLIDEDGKPTELAITWRDDSTYRDACDRMVRRAFPEVVDRFPPPRVKRSELESWFAMTTRTGANTARQMAAFYCLLAAGEFDASRDVRNRDDGRDSKVSARQAARKNAAAEGQTSSFGDKSVLRRGNETDIRAGAPLVPINIHFHISADASEAQIEALLRSAMKYVGSLGVTT